MTVSKEIENRIEDSNSTAARIKREPDWSSRPWVETVMAADGQLTQKNRADHLKVELPLLGCVANA